MKNIVEFQNLLNNRKAQITLSEPFMLQDVSLIALPENEISMTIKNIGSYRLSFEARNRIRDMLRIPHMYYNRININLQQANLDGQLQDLIDTTDTIQFKNILDKQVIISIVPAMFEFVSAADIFAHTLTCFTEKFPNESVYLYQESIAINMVRFAIVLDSLYEVTSEDIIKIGVDFNFYDYSIQHSMFSLYVFRQICTNGMLVPTQYKMSKQIDTYIPHIKELITQLITAIEPSQIVEHFRLLQQTSVLNPKQAIFRIGRENRLPDKYINQAQNAYDLEPLPNMWGVYNSFSRVAAENDTLNRHQQQRLQIVAGTSLKSLVARCEKCSALL